jgi:hypothetical protein
MFNQLKLTIMRLNKKHDGTKQYPIFCKIDEDNWQLLSNEPNKTRTINQALEEYWENHAQQFFI